MRTTAIVTVAIRKIKQKAGACNLNFRFMYDGSYAGRKCIVNRALSR